MSQAGQVIRARHLDRRAVVYVRQSTATQVRENTESTRLQYALGDLAQQWGWAPERIEIIDEDLGVSGSGDQHRSGFARLTLMVARGEVGVVLGLDSSRLSRNTAEWFELLRWLRLTDTLFAKEGRVYDLQQSDSRIVLGIEGTLSEEDRFRIRGRLDAGIESKAARGEFYRNVAAGYQLEAGQLRKDPDERVQHAIAEVFARFRETGSARQTAIRLRGLGQHLPVGRAGEVVWAEATYSRVYQVLKNPVMAGAYVFGRQRTELAVDGSGKVRKKVVRLPRKDWRVVIRDHHEGYVGWQELEAVQRRLAGNSLHGGKGAPREGRALLQGLAVCGLCGRRLQAQYGSGVRYGCRGEPNAPRQRGCQSVGAARIERWVAERFLEAAGMGGVEAALRAERCAHERQARRLQNHSLELERCRYEAGLAARRYRAEDPDNRLVMRSLARDWQASLEAVERAQEALRQAERATPALDPPVCSRRFAELGAQVRQLWESPHLPSRDRKRLLATLVEEVVLAVDRSAGRVGVVLRWRGGRTDECELPLPKRGGQQKESASTVELVRRLAALYRDRQIADTLNAQERRTVSGKRFTAKLVASLRQRYGIEGYRRDAREQGQAPLVSVREAAQELGTTAGTLYRWIRQGFLTAEPPVVQGAPMRVRLTAKVRERFCESCPEGFVPAAEARRNMGLSRQSLWQRIREGTLVARRIVRGPEKGLYVQWEESRQLPLLGPADEDEGTEGSA